MALVIFKIRSRSNDPREILRIEGGRFVRPRGVVIILERSTIFLSSLLRNRALLHDSNRIKFKLLIFFLISKSLFLNILLPSQIFVINFCQIIKRFSKNSKISRYVDFLNNFNFYSSRNLRNPH